MKIVKQLTGYIKAIDKEERTITAYVSTGEIDRAGERIPPEEWHLDNYKNNPVILWAHDYRQPPVAKALWTKADKTGLMQKIKFAQTDFAQDIFDLYEGGFLNAFSVGFDAQRDNEDMKKFINAELLEVSCVPVPCNANALMERAASGLIKSPEALAFVKTLTPEKTETPEEAEARKKAEADAVTEAGKAAEAKAAAEAIIQKASLTADMLKELDDLSAENERLKTALKEAKEGRVLSAKNRELIKNCAKALQDLLTATEEEEGKSNKTIDKRKFSVIINNKDRRPPTEQPLAEIIGKAIAQADIPGMISKELKRRTGAV